MKKVILKIGENIYSQSLQHFSKSYLKGFPQREQFLLKHAEGVEFDFFRHSQLVNITTTIKERDRLNKFLDTRKYDYLMIDNPFSVLVIDPRIKTPIIFDCIDWYEEMYLKEFGIDKRFFLLRYGILDLLERANKVIAQSPVILESLKSWGLKTKDYAVISNGYDSGIFYPYSEAIKSKTRKELENKYKIKFGNKKIIVYTGKLGIWYEDIKLIAKAITDDQIFLIVGDGPIRNQIPNQPNIVKCGAVSLQEVPCYTNIADVLVFPVSVDCSPIAISEYLAVGKPIVMGKGRMEWLLRDKQTGCMVDNNINAWRLGIMTASKMGNICRKNNLILAKDLSWQKLSHKFAAFISNI